MKLTGPEIQAQIERGNIIITPFDPSCLGPNSYDVTLGNHLLLYQEEILDARRVNHTYDIFLPADGGVLLPGTLYLGHTNEIVGVPANATEGFVPCLEGKSGVGRLGIQIHATAGFGDDGFVGDWTLEITVAKAVRVYPNQLIGQVFFEPVIGKRKPYNGSYQGQRGPQSSRLWTSFTQTSKGVTE